MPSSRKEKATESSAIVDSGWISTDRRYEKIPFSNRRAKAYTTVLPINRVQWSPW